MLKAPLSILELVKSKHPEILHGALGGIDDIYRYFKSYKQNWKNNPVYIAKVDVANCFDTINTHKLKEIIKEIPQWKEWDDYNITGYSAISSSLGQPTISHKSRAHEYFPQFPEFAECLSQTSKNTIFCDRLLLRRHEAKKIIICGRR
ncbi:hypothetical protein BC936DRAFT_139466 [Jimgerdemannia flammicorona]|uniref:Telomerase reverse transcriptase n=1 Tax=Jimgerdemannia flammicorona TaxID=994334 RepID=A0A433B9T7_9FUNG|nr:hypothetical protein BC936DRAFT_139466 [Jimgerdemannia flammicorona]